jgi:hypothetical protein
MALPDCELWAADNHVLRQYGDQADAHITERVTTLAEAGDVGGAITSDPFLRAFVANKT